MPDRDATLDAFITPDAETDEAGDGNAEDTDAAPEEAEPKDGEVDGDEPEQNLVTDQAETTFAWSPEAVACEVCGEETRRRWRTDAGFVCPDCVDWERAPEH